MSLRWKLALLFGGLLAIITVLGLQSLRQVTDLGRSVDVVLRENYQSVVAAQEMKEALDRMDSGALFILLGDDREGEELIAGNEPRFEKALDIELHNITLPGEADKAALLRQLFRKYQADIRVLRDPAVGRTSKHRAYFQGLLPLFRQIKSAADDIQRMNQENMVAMDRKARTQAESARRQMFVMFLATVAVTAVILLLTGKWILQPITRLTRSAEEIRKGNLDLVVPGGSRDEVGRLSDAFNAMAESLREFRRSDQARLLRIQRSTQQAFDSLPEVIAVISPDGEVEVATEAAREGFGLKPSTRLKDLPIPWIKDLFDEAIRSGRETDMSGNGAVVQHFVRGEERFCHPRAVPILDALRHPTGAVLVLSDVTQQHHQDELKKGVISTVSHQLKTPLTSIRMAMHLLLEEKVGGLTEKQAELLVAAREDADRLHVILADLIDISRIESGKVSLDCRRITPLELVLEAIEPFLGDARDRGVMLGSELPEELPDVWADRTRIAHVFENLLSNALKYTPPGGRVTLSAQSGPEYVRFIVSDTGRGIPGEYLPRVFEQFFRVPDQEKESGAGLGLAIAKEIIRAHGGTIGVESREGGGTRFSFTLRRADKVDEGGAPV